MNWLQRLLGLPYMSADLRAIQDRQKSHGQALANIARDIRVLSLACSRIIAKLDPNYIVAEDDPDRKADSDAIGEEVLRKLYAEHDAANIHRRS